MAKNIKRVVSTGFWEDSKVMTSFSPEDKYFMLYLLTNPHTNQLGIYQLVPKMAAFEMGYSVEAVTSLIERFESKYQIIKYNPDTMEVAIKNFLKHSILKGGKPVFDCLMQDKKTVKDKSLLSFITDLADEEGISTTVKDFLEAVKEESTKEENILNDNDNDNDSIVPRYVDDSYHDSYHDSSKQNLPLRGHDLEIAQKAGFANDNELLDAFADFLKMRKSIKKPMTDRAITMLSSQLEKLAPGNVRKKIKILNQSTFHCWQGVFELKNDAPEPVVATGKPTVISPLDLSEYDIYGNRRQ